MTDDLRRYLDDLHSRYHRPEYLGTDPLVIVRRYPHPADREVVALIAASFAFGNVVSINATLDRILQPLGPSPALALRELDPRAHFRGFAYRWVRAADLRVYLHWIGAALRVHGSLGALWQSLDDPAGPDIIPTLQRFVDALTSQEHALSARRRFARREGRRPSRLPSGAHLLLTSPEGGSACKRMCLFLRWVARPDDGIDLGLWPHVSPGRLVMPVDTHVHRLSRELGLTGRRAADLRTAREITDALRAVAPDDPCRYDFALTRQGMLSGARAPTPQRGQHDPPGHAPGQ